MDEIAEICDQGFSTIRKINAGLSYHRDDLEYPIRSIEDKEFLHRMRYKECRPSIEYRMEHSARDAYEQYKESCRKKNAEGRKIPIIFDEEIGIDFVDEILSTSFPEVAEKYGYQDVTRVQNHLKTANLPYKLRDLQTYYERHTGHPHASSSAVKKQSKRKNPRISRAVAQYDGTTRKLIDVFLTIADAARSVEVRVGGIIQAGQASGRAIKCGGYYWRMLDIDGNIIIPTDYTEYYNSHRRACVACGTELPNNAASDFCEDCQSVKSHAATVEDLLADPDWLLNALANSNYTALGVLYNMSGSALRTCILEVIAPDELDSAREAVKNARLAVLRTNLPEYLPEES